MTISEAFDIYDQYLQHNNRSIKTRKNYVTARNSFSKHVGDIPVSLVTLNHLTVWTDQMREYGLQASSQATNISRLKEVLKYMRVLGISVIDSRDISRPSIPNKHYTWLTPHEVLRMIKVTDSLRDKAIIASLFATGARITELLNLNRDDIKGNEAAVNGKGNKIRSIYFDAVSLKYINDYLDTRNDLLRPLFVSAQCRRITVGRVQQLIHIYADMAGIDKNVTPHVFRHSYASDLKMNGAGIFDIKELLGHTQVSTTLRYSHVNDEYKKSVYDQYHSI